MWYIFKSDGNCISSSDFKPNIEDLSSRGEIAVESQLIFDISKIVLNNNNIVDKVIPQPTTEEIIKSIVNATQLRLDGFAQTRNYDSILSACSYATSKTVKFQVEGQYCVEIREATWNKLYEILAEVKSGIRVAPISFTDIEAELPALAWPVV